MRAYDGPWFPPINRVTNRLLRRAACGGSKQEKVLGRDRAESPRVEGCRRRRLRLRLQHYSKYLPPGASQLGVDQGGSCGSQSTIDSSLNSLQLFKFYSVVGEGILTPGPSLGLLLCLPLSRGMAYEGLPVAPRECTPPGGVPWQGTVSSLWILPCLRWLPRPTEDSLSKRDSWKGLFISVPSVLHTLPMGYFMSIPAS